MILTLVKNGKIVLLPILLNLHWFLVIVSINSLLIYDSMISKNTADIIKSDINNRKNNISKLIDLSEKVYDLILKNFNLNEMYIYIRQAQDILEYMNRWMK